MRPVQCILLVQMMLLGTPTFAHGAQSSDWPCTQRKVPEISLAAVWQGPSIDEASAKWRDDATISDLVQLLAARRTSAESAKSAIAQFAASAGAEKKPRLLKVVAGLVELANLERSQVISGLERFGKGQKQFAEQVRRENAEVAELRSNASADPAKINQLVERLTWNLRIFEERQKSLRFVCEVPVVIEQRLFGILKSIEAAIGQQ